jgi:PIN domain nuclease of toxin-antitoxin system
LIVLDTHALLWWVSDNSHLSRKAARRITAESENAGGLLVSCISTWEIAMLVSQSRLTLRIDLGDLFHQLESIESIQFVPVSNRTSMNSVTLPEPFHKDPADRLIVATARESDCTLITSDQMIRDYPHVETLW